MATTDRRGVALNAASVASAANRNPGAAIKAPVRVATTGSAIVLSGLQTIDGIALTAQDPVLVKDQTDATQNGLWSAASGTWTRTADADGAGELTQGMLVEVAQGTINGGALFELSAPAGVITIGTSQLVFTSAAAPVCIEAVFDGGGAPLTTALNLLAEIASRITLKRWTLLADRVGSIELDIWKAPYASLPLSVANTIVGGAYPALANAQFNQASNLSGWTPGLSAGDVLGFAIRSVDLVQRVTLSLYGTRP